MSNTYHENHRMLKGLSAKQIDELADDPDSILHRLAEKRFVKKSVKDKRSLDKSSPSEDEIISVK
jgi:hypothetical protein